MISNERSWCIPDQLLLRTKTPGRERLEDGAGVGPSIDSQFFSQQHSNHLPSGYLT